MLKKIIILTLITNSLKTQCPYNDEKCISCAGTKCTICIGSFVNKKGICETPQKKIWRCLMYNLDGSCKSCKYGYYLSKQGTCLEISQKGCLQLDYENKCIMCNEGVMIDEGSCSSNKNCLDNNCKYCGFINNNEKCLVCKENYAVLIQKGEYRCIKEKETNKNCWIVTSGNIEQCAICKIDYFFKGGVCVESDEYIVFMEHGLKKVFLGVLISFLFFLS